jgi:hypothetical protein
MRRRCNDCTVGSVFSLASPGSAAPTMPLPPHCSGHQGEAAGLLHLPGGFAVGAQTDGSIVPWQSVF